MKRMPALFVGHGSPMNAIEENQFSRTWAELGKRLPRPEAILSVSAHWFTSGTLVSDSPAPKMIYDMYGFPDALYKVVYAAPGAPRFAELTRELIGDAAKLDNTWGLDHGTWSVLRWLYPSADVPVYQLSVNRQASAQEHFDLGRAIGALRGQGVLVLGSGNIVHNLAETNWSMDGGYPWAEKFDAYVKANILSRDFDNVIHYEKAGESARVAFRLPDHYAPLLYVLGASDPEDAIDVSNNACTLGSISMTSYLFS